jgi:hypothetical protein
MLFQPPDLINAAGARFGTSTTSPGRIANHTGAEAIRLAGVDPDHATADLLMPSPGSQGGVCA